VWITRRVMRSATQDRLSEARRRLKIRRARPYASLCTAALQTVEHRAGAEGNRDPQDYTARRPEWSGSPVKVWSRPCCLLEDSPRRPLSKNLSFVPGNGPASPALPLVLTNRLMYSTGCTGKTPPDDATLALTLSSCHSAMIKL
jgi:hypothetical protein